MKMRRSWTALPVLPAAMLLSGCGLFQPQEDPEVARKCTSITNVLGKNYKLGARFSYLLAGAGFNYERSGVVLSAEAANRQIEMDRLCRLWATKGITDEKWAEIYTNHIVASAAVAARIDRPEVQAELGNNLSELKDLLGQLNADKKDASAIPTLDEMKKMIADAKQQDDQQLTATLDRINDSVTKRLDAKGTTLVEEYRQTAATYAQHQATLQLMIGGLQEQIRRLPQPQPLPNPQPKPHLQLNPPPALSWQALPPFRVKFASGQYELSEIARTTLRDQFKSLHLGDDMRIDLVGYTDKRGNHTLNAALSIARAQEVRSYLVNELVVPPSNITVYGQQFGVSKFGEHAENRVVEIKVYYRAQIASTQLGAPNPLKSAN